MKTLGNFMTAQGWMPCYTEPSMRAMPLSLLCQDGLLHTN
jgi:hypothetical protein